MNHMTVYLKNKVLNDNLRTSTVYVGLFENDNEINKPSYQRQSIGFIEPSEGQTSNDTDVFFPIAQEEWGNITHIGIFDAETNGNLLFKAPAEFVKHIDVSGQYRIPKNYLIVRLR